MRSLFTLLAICITTISLGQINDNYHHHFRDATLLHFNGKTLKQTTKEKEELSIFFYKNSDGTSHSTDVFFWDIEANRLKWLSVTDFLTASDYVYIFHFKEKDYSLFVDIQNKSAVLYQPTDNDENIFNQYTYINYKIVLQ